MFCPNCGRNVNDTAKFCVGCGTPLGGAEQQNQPVLMLQNEFMNVELNKKKSKKWPVFIVLGILVIACGVFIAVLRGKGDSVTEKTTGKTIKETLEQLENADVGDYITFGTYEQDNDLENGAEPIEWLVLEKKDGKALVLSKYALDCKKYNEEWVDVTWETCILRSWLNNEFYTTAFNKTERSAIVQTLIKNEDNPEYGTEGGNDTKDKVFLLSIEEVTTYFDADPDAYDPARRAKITEYAIAQGGWHSTTDEYYGNGWWWLRSPGGKGDNAAGVDFNSDVILYGYFVGLDNNVVRPALWIAY